MTTNETVWVELGQCQGRVEFLTNRLNEIYQVTDDDFVKKIIENSHLVLAELTPEEAAEAAEQKLVERKIDEALERAQDDGE